MASVTSSSLEFNAGSGIPGRYVLSNERTSDRGDCGTRPRADSRRVEWKMLVTITDSSPDSITEIPQALIGVVGLFGV
jgi:hypothetical protein